MCDDTERPRLRIRTVFGAEEMLGPGKGEHLERIDRSGSIAAAGGEMGKSCKRAWELVGRTNAMSATRWSRVPAAVRAAAARY